MKKNKKALAMIYAERIAPIVSWLALIAVMFIPSVQFSLDSDKRKVFSLWGLLGNTWKESRHYLFSASVKRTSEGELFYRAVFAILIVLFILFIIGIAISIWSSAVSLSYYKDKTPSSEAEKAKNIFTAVIPNRFVLSLLRMTILPLLFFPDVLVILYRKLLLYNVSVNFTTVHYGMIAVILFVAISILTVVSIKSEKRLGMNIFAKENFGVNGNEDEYSAEEAALSNEPLELRRMKDSSEAEQTERIRSLLGYSENNDKN